MCLAQLFRRVVGTAFSPDWFRLKLGTVPQQQEECRGDDAKKDVPRRDDRASCHSQLRRSCPESVKSPLQEKSNMLSRFHEIAQSRT